MDSIPQDTIGAGDSFIAGFIFVLLREGSLRSCIEYAVSLFKLASFILQPTQIWTAQKMIQQVGVTLPQSLPEPPLLPAGKKVGAMGSLDKVKSSQAACPRQLFPVLS